MFEDSLFASGVSIDSTQSARRTRKIAFASVAIQSLLLVALLVVPLVWPETLPLVSVAPKVALLSRPKPIVKVEQKQVRVTTTPDTAIHAPAAAPTFAARISRPIHSGPAIVQAGEGPSLYTGSSIGGPPSLATVLSVPGAGAPTIVAATPKKAEPLPISQGVSKGLLLAPIQPVYPRIAIAARVEGTVIVTATIDKTGRITGLHVTSGPEMLKSAALDAIKDARYKPYLLNGQPTDVITTISVTFRIGA